MNSLIKIVAVFAMVVGLSIQVAAKDKKRLPQGPDKNQECHWLNPPQIEVCEEETFSKGFAQCGAFVVVGYCKQSLAGATNDCLDDNSDRTKDCYKQSTASFSEQLRKQDRKKGRRVVSRPGCAWNTDVSYQPGNRFFAKCADDDNRVYEYRRATCTVDGREYTPFFFCATEDVSHTATTCMADEENQATLRCRHELFGARANANSANPPSHFRTNQ